MRNYSKERAKREMEREGIVKRKARRGNGE